MIKQQQFITISMNEIPILVNKKGHRLNDVAFKILPISEKYVSLHKRQRTFDSNEKAKLQDRKHDTLDPQKLKEQGRYRRASSSGASNKFPKDFFKQNIPNTPIRIRFSRAKKQNIQSVQKSKFRAIQERRFRDIQERKFNSCQKPKKSYNIQINDSLIECQNQVQTPKFNHRYKEQHISLNETQNKKIKIQEYLTHKKQELISCFNHENNCFQTLQFNPVSQTTKQCPLHQIFLQTLGKKANILKQVNPIKLRFISKRSIKEKQNVQIQQCRQKSIKQSKQHVQYKKLNNVQTNLNNNQKNINQVQTNLNQLQKILNNVQNKINQLQKNVNNVQNKINHLQFGQCKKVTNKSIKQFLSTKGLNWKNVQKTNFNKIIQANASRQALSIISKVDDQLPNIFKDIKKCQKSRDNTFYDAQLSRLPDESRFRIRKYV